jgi:hypothetical protein
MLMEKAHIYHVRSEPEHLAHPPLRLELPSRSVRTGHRESGRNRVRVGTVTHEDAH